jgi:hypothetical protein
VRRIALVLCVLALPAFADEKPDYSRDSLTAF